MKRCAGGWDSPKWGAVTSQPLLVALVPPPSDPEMAVGFYGHLLGEGWTVRGFRSSADIPDDVAGEMEFLVAPPPARVDSALLERARALRLIQVPGHGFDHVDIAAARAAGVPVATVASSGAEASTVAEMVLLLAGALLRRIPEVDAHVRAGGWGHLEMLQRGVFELAGKAMGIVGLGRIGREVAKRARAFDLRVLYFNPRRVPPDVEAACAAEYRSLEELLAEADVVSLHAPLTAQTRGLIDRRALARMKPSAVLINTARGALVDATALAEALREGRIGGAAIDVFDVEPPPLDHPLRGAPNCLLSAHMAGVTAESVLRILRAALENCRRVARGERPLDMVEEAEAG